MAHGKRFRADIEGWDREKAYPLTDAVTRIKGFKKTKFDQSIEICMHLGIDAKQADQALRGAIALPHGIGASKRVVAFCKDDMTAKAKAAGAMEAGGEELVKKIEGGWMDFDVAIATPDMMRVVSKLGKVLGPKGLMPSPKSGTVTPELERAVREYAAGKVEFRNDAGGNVQAVIGKQSFDEKQIIDNAQAFIDNIVRMRPAAARGHYVKKITLSGTMTPGVQVEHVAVAQATA
ncbi:MAG: 50S ribosomal protein L1 [Planctomycetes bacterium]|nr:50S ribosomal protein L1 [Planctomycetota bacterium]